MSHWLTEGGTLGASLRRFTCIVVAGPDRDATSEVALGIAESQAAHRRVVLADLLDDAPRYAAMRLKDDHHGIVDSLHYGTSLARVTRPVAGTDGLHFAPTGSDITDYGELLLHPRWSRLIRSFADSGELLVLAAPIGAPGLDDLVTHTDGLVLVDGQIPAKLDPAHVIAVVRAAPAPPASRPPLVPAGAAAAAAAPGALRPPVTSPKTVAHSAPRQATSPPQRLSNQSAPRSASKTAEAPRTIAAGKPIPGLNRSVVVGALLSLVVALFIYSLAERSPAESESPPGRATPAVPPLLKRPATAASKKPADPNSIDPADSGAAAFAVQIMAANTQVGAILKLQEHGSALPAATYAPVAIQGTTWFKVVAGAFATRGGADSLLAALRTGRLLDSTEGVVVHVPFSLRIDSVRTAETVSDLLAQLRVGRNLPVYALVQRNGWVWVMVGAFETRLQADKYAEMLRSVGLTPELVYRQGRMF